jgi:uncharacterized protein YciI
MSDIPTFIYLLRLVNPESFNKMSFKEEKIINNHFEHLKKGLDKGTLILAGPCLDGAFGIVIFRAASLKEAETFMNSDPAVTAGVMTAELHPFRVSLSTF